MKYFKVLILGLSFILTQPSYASKDVQYEMRFLKGEGTKPKEGPGQGTGTYQGYATPQGSSHTGGSSNSSFMRDMFMSHEEIEAREHRRRHNDLLHEQFQHDKRHQKEIEKVEIEKFEQAKREQRRAEFEASERVEHEKRHRYALDRQGEQQREHDRRHRDEINAENARRAHVGLPSLEQEAHQKRIDAERERINAERVRESNERYERELKTRKITESIKQELIQKAHEIRNDSHATPLFKKYSEAVHEVFVTHDKDAYYDDLYIRKSELDFRYNLEISERFNSHEIQSFRHQEYIQYAKISFELGIESTTQGLQTDAQAISEEVKRSYRWFIYDMKQYKAPGNKHYSDSYYYRGIAKDILNFVTDAVPYTSMLKSTVYALVGTDFYTGEKLSVERRALHILNVISFGTGRYIRAASRINAVMSMKYPDRKYNLTEAKDQSKKWFNKMGKSRVELRKVLTYFKDQGIKDKNKKKELLDAYMPGARIEVLEKDLDVVRYYEKEVGRIKAQWMTELPIEDHIEKLALYSNGPYEISHQRIPAGTTVMRGLVAPTIEPYQRGGGATQIYVHDPANVIILNQ